jgi:L-amino acid N-acyltransferase
MENNVEIVKARIDDLQLINDIFNESILNSFSNWSNTERSYEDAQKWFYEHNTDKYCLFVAKIHSVVVGFGSLSRFRGNDGYVKVAENSVYVHKDYRRMRIGSLLMDKLIYTAINCDIIAISAWIDSENKESIKLHEKFDFYKIGEMKNIGRKYGKKRSVTIMQLDLDGGEDNKYE